VKTFPDLLAKAGYRTGAFSERQTDELISFLHAPTPRPQPFFAQWTLDSPRGFAQRLDPKGIDVRNNVPASYADEARKRLADFYGRLPSKDQELGVILAALDRPELARDTAVIFTSDHGAQLGSHNMMEDDVAFEESMRIPLAVRYPRGVTGQGRTNAGLISQVDLAPSILKLAGVAAPNEMQGRDVSQLLFAGGGELPEAVYAEGRIGDRDEFRMLVHGYDKIIVGMGEKAGDTALKNYYNLADDPLEMTNLSLTSSEQLKRDSLMANVQQWMKRVEDRMDVSGLRVR
jgi:arylsulfatase A-like enzyme